MARPSKGTWDPRRGVYVAALGEPYVSPTSGRPRRRNVVLTHEDGVTPVGRGDEAGRLAALARLVAASAEELRRTCDPTVAELFQGWVDWMRIAGYEESTVGVRVRTCNRVCAVPWRGKPLGHLEASRFDTEHLFAVRKHLRRRGASEGYVTHHDNIIMNCFRWAAQAIEDRDPVVLLKRDPFPRGHVKKGRQSRSERPCPSMEGLRTILDAIDRYVAEAGYDGWHGLRARCKALQIRIIGERGCRPSEVARLRTDEWDDESGGFRLGRHKTAHRGVVGVIPLGGPTAARVRELIGVAGRAGPWVFAPWKAEAAGPGDAHRITAWWIAIRGRIGVEGAEKYQLYSFRNTISNHLRLRGVDGRELQLALRHTQPVADSVYRRDTLAEAARVFREAGL